MFKTKKRQLEDLDLSAIVNGIQEAAAAAQEQQEQQGSSNPLAGYLPSSAPSREVIHSLLEGLPLYALYLFVPYLQRGWGQLLPFVPALMAGVDELLVDPMQARGAAIEDRKKQIETACEELKKLGGTILSAEDVATVKAELPNINELLAVICNPQLPAGEKKTPDKAMYNLLLGGVVWLAGRVT